MYTGTLCMYSDTVEKSVGVMRTQCHAMLKDHMMMKGSDYPWDIG